MLSKRRPDESIMARVLIRDLDERTVQRLKTRASRNGRSLQAELLMIVERAVAVDVLESREVAARIRRKLGGRKHSDSAALLADDRRR
jgi:plasmid stability protein